MLVRDMVSPGSRMSPDRNGTKPAPFLPKCQAIMQAALDTAHSLCPDVVQKSGVRDQLVNAMSERIHLQDHLNLSAVLDQMITDVFSKLKWVMVPFFPLTQQLALTSGPRREFWGVPANCSPPHLMVVCWVLLLVFPAGALLPTQIQFG